MAWFDILGGISQGLGQAAEGFQQQLLRQRQREDQLRQEAEERRRFELGQQQLARQEARARAGEARAAEQFALTKQQALDQDVERVLSTFEEDTIPDEVVKWAVQQSPKTAKALITKAPEGGYTRRLSKAERQAAEDRAYQLRQRRVDEPLLAERERILGAPDIAALSLAERKQAAKLRGLSEDAYLTPKEKIEDAKTSQNYLVTQLAASLAAARQQVVTPEQKRLMNAQVDKFNFDAQRVARDQEREFYDRLQEVIEAKYGTAGVKNSGQARWLQLLDSLPPEEKTKAKLAVVNVAREKLGYPPTTNPSFRLNPEVLKLEHPYPEMRGKSVQLGGTPTNPLGGVRTPAVGGTTLTLQDGSVVTVSP